MEKLNSIDGSSCALLKSAGASESLGVLHGYYTVSCQRVLPEHRDEALRLSALLREAPDAEAAHAVGARLSALPRREAWFDDIHNVVTTVGKNKVLDEALAGSGYTAAVVMGLKGTGTAVAGDTQASHGGWSEVGGTNAPAYTGDRKVPTLGAAAAGAKGTSSNVSFTFTSGGTVAGCFINLGGSATKDNTTGTLLSAGDFTNGNKTVADTDVLNVSWSLSL
jgi:hypothetical protein